MPFVKANKAQSKLRLAFTGPSGSGKSYSSLAIATALLSPGQRIAVIDTERGSASLYGDLFDFDVNVLETFAPDEYIKAIAEAEAAGYGVIIIDSLSHAWNGVGGILERVDKTATKPGQKGPFQGWIEATPIQNRFLDVILRSKAHVICTMRSKTEWVLEENKQGKIAPRKVGTTPVQRQEIDYEFDVFGDFDVLNYLTVTKTRCPALSGVQIHQPGADFGKILMDWLNKGVPAAQPVPAPPTVVPSAEQGPEPKPAVAGSQSPQTPVQRVAGMIKAANSHAQLTAIVPTIMKLSNREKEAVKPLYGARQRELNQPAPEPQSVPEAADEPGPPSSTSLTPPEIRKALLAAATVAEAEAAMAKADPTWDPDVHDDLRGMLEEVLAKLSPLPVVPAEPVQASLDATLKAEVVTFQPKPPEAQSAPASKTAAQIATAVAADIEREIKEATASALDVIETKIGSSDLPDSTKSILRDEVAQRRLTLRGDPEAELATRRRKAAVDLIRRYKAEIEESLSTGHPAKARAAKINARRSANAGEITRAEADEIGKRAEEVVATCDERAKPKAS